MPSTDALYTSMENGDVSSSSMITSTSESSRPYPAASGLGRLTPLNVGRAIVARFMRTVRRGNLPFLLLFVSCTLVFFSALAGIGYVEPPSEAAVAAVGTLGRDAPGSPGFVLGGPVFDPSQDQLSNAKIKAAQKQRELELLWSKKKRPKDGLWMQKQRDDKAVRRVPPSAPVVEVPNVPYEEKVEGAAEEGDDAAQGLA
ncbi:hypothetical protein P7C73_g1479, partial [Tremellales sp. Uapishka_1]